MLDLETSVSTGDFLRAATPFIKSIVDTFISPKLEKAKKRLSNNYKTTATPYDEHFTEYMHRTFKRVSVLNTLVFKNSQILLKDIYLPLTLKRIDITDTSDAAEQYKLIDYPSKMLKSYERVLIIDSAGMGKSTISKKVFIDTIESKKGVPVLIELRRLNKEKTILNELKEQLNTLSEDFDNNLLMELIESGGFIFLLDGFDEIPLSDRQIVTSDIQQFISKASKNTFILTSRPEGALAGFGDFQEFRILPLKKKEAYELLRKYDQKGEVSSLLIKKLDESNMSSIDEFLTNPLLVTLLFTAFRHKQTIPFKKHLFYRQVYDANFDKHDLTKGDSFIHDKYCKLDTDDFASVLRHMGYSCLRDNQRIEFTKDELLLIISNARKFCSGLSFKDSDFLNDLLITVPLFTQDGIYYRWAHKSLQEYFAAQFIHLDAKEKQTAILNRMYESPSVDKFINVLDLYYDIDVKTFRKTILYRFLKDFEEYFKSQFPNSLDGLSSDDITLRKELCFLITPFFFLMDDYKKIHLSENNQFGEMINKFDKRVSGPLIPCDKQNLFCLINNDPRGAIMQIIIGKIPEIFTPLLRRKAASIMSRTVKYEIKHDLTRKCEPFFLNDSTSNQFNSIDNFSTVNEIISYSKLHPYQINSVKALELLAQIEEDLINEADEDFLLN
jgi:hypothetical protein